MNTLYCILLFSMMRVFLIRHGQTDYNVKHLIQGTFYKSLIVFKKRLTPKSSLMSTCTLEYQLSIDIKVMWVRVLNIIKNCLKRKQYKRFTQPSRSKRSPSIGTVAAGQDRVRCSVLVSFTKSFWNGKNCN